MIPVIRHGEPAGRYNASRPKPPRPRAEILLEIAPDLIGRCYRFDKEWDSLALIEWHRIERELAPHLGDGEVRCDGIGYPDGILYFDDGLLCWTDPTFDFMNKDSL